MVIKKACFLQILRYAGWHGAGTGRCQTDFDFIAVMLPLANTHVESEKGKEMAREEMDAVGGEDWEEVVDSSCHQCACLGGSFCHGCNR